MTEAAIEASEAAAHGGACANCGAALRGAYCHVCGQSAHSHKKALRHLVWEAIEGLFHLDGRLASTVPALFLRPGRLARDYMDGRLARHVPPFRLFLVALLIFIFAAEYRTHQLVLEAERANAAHEAAMQTPQGRAAEAAKVRKAAAADRIEDLQQAAQDRAEELKDPDDTPAKVEARYQKWAKAAEDRYERQLAKADRMEKGLAEPPLKDNPRNAWLKEPLRKALENPEFFWSALFTWSHRLALVLLPIVALALATVYPRRRGLYFYDHLLVAMEVMSFTFLVNAPAFLLPAPAGFWWAGAVALWTPVNLFQILRGGYGSSLAGAAAKTAAVWLLSATAFALLLLGLLFLTLSQLR